MSRCYFCGEVSDEKHSIVCIYQDHQFQVRIDTELNPPLNVIIPIKKTDASLAKLYYYTIKSVDPSALICVLPSFDNIKISFKCFQEMQEMGWKDNTSVKINMIIINSSQIGQDVLNTLEFIDNHQLKNAGALLLDFWFNLEDSQINDFVISSFGFHQWSKFSIQMSNKFFDKLIFLKDYLEIDEKYNHLSLGPSFLLTHANSVIFNNTKTITNFDSKLYWCKFYKTDLVQLGPGKYCKTCKIKHKDAVSACTYCNKLINFTNLCAHEKKCSFKFADAGSSISLIVLLMSVGDDGDIRSNIFAEYLKFKQDADLNVNKYLITRFRFDDEKTLLFNLTISRINQLCELSKYPEIVPIIVFVFCDRDNDLDKIGNSVIDKIPHIHTIHFSIRLQTIDLIQTLKTNKQFSSSFITTQFRYIQMLEFYSQMIFNFRHSDYQLKLEFVAFKSIEQQFEKMGTGFSEAFFIFKEIVRFFGEQNISKRVIVDQNTLWKQFKNFISHTTPIFNITSSTFKTFVSILKSFEIQTDEQDYFLIPQHFQQLITIKRPLFKKNIFVKASLINN